MTPTPLYYLIVKCVTILIAVLILTVGGCQVATVKLFKDGGYEETLVPGSTEKLWTLPKK